MTRRPIILDDGIDKIAKIAGYNKRLKIIMSILTLGGIVVASLYFYGIWHKENKTIESRLETFTELRSSTLSRFVNSLSQETILWAHHKSVVNEAQRYFEIWDGMGSDDRQKLRSEFIDKKPNAKASDAYAAYITHHKKFNLNRKKFMHHHGYYDVFYFNMEGDLVYTVEKENDYALNYQKGASEYASSGLGNVYREARELDKGASVFFDFAPYAPSNDAPASFLAAPIFAANGTKVGVYAVQVSLKNFNAVLNYSSGLGQTGETYVVGQDFLMRNNSRLSKEPTMLVRKIDTPAVQQALAGKAVLTKGTNTSGAKTLISAQPLEFSGTKWAIVTEMELAELRAPFKPYLWFYLAAIGFILVFGWIQYLVLRQKTAH
ncbi:MAG: cache domain-containing protein [Rhizobiaceae bacterium]